MIMTNVMVYNKYVMHACSICSYFTNIYNCKTACSMFRVIIKNVVLNISNINKTLYLITYIFLSENKYVLLYKIPPPSTLS